MKHPSSITRPVSGFATFGAILSGLVALGLPAFAGAEEETPAAESTTNAGEDATADVEKPEAAEEAGKDESAEPAAIEAAPGDYRNWFSVSVGGLIVDGDSSAAQRRLGLPASAFGGVEEFHFEKDVGKTGLFKIDGRGIFNNDEYRLRLDYTDTDKGFVRGGLEQYRQYYDGSAGWFPANNGWFDLYDDRLELIRGKAYFEAGLRKANVPEITLRYDHDWREGRKDSTIWGDSDVAGAGVRSFVPTFLDLDEKRDTVSIDVRHTLGKTTFGGTFLYESTDLDNSRNIRRRPGESSDRYVTQTEKVESDLYSARAFVDTVFNDKVRMTSAYAFTTLDTDLGGSRLAGSDYDPVYDPVNARRDIGFYALGGGSQLDQHVWNANVLWTPVPGVSIVPAFRLENQNLDGSSAWTDTTPTEAARSAANSRDMLDLSQQLELRYTGVTNVVFYARGDWVQGDGNLLETQRSAASGTTDIHRDTDFDRFGQKYTAGAHWYPLQRLNLHAQYYRKMRDNEYDTDAASYVNYLGDLYPGYILGQDFTTDDVNIRITWRPMDKLTLVTRYDYQISTIETETGTQGATQAGRSTAHIIGETVTWTPISRLYVQPGVNFVLDRTETGAADGSDAPLEPARNNYFNVTCLVGVVVDDRTDLQAQYSYYLADNFNDLSAVSQPYGAGTEEHGIVTSLIRRLSPRLRATLRYGFYTSRSEMAGGYNDYDAHLVYSSVQYLF